MTNFEFSLTWTLVSSANVMPTLPCVVLIESAISTPVPLAPVRVDDLRRMLGGVFTWSVILPTAAKADEQPHSKSNNVKKYFTSSLLVTCCDIPCIT